jgi:PadR family transcriptional regulator PadR
MILVSESDVKFGGRIMKTENSKAQMRKGVLEYCILLGMGEKPRYSVDIIQGLKDSRMIVVEGTLYPLLARLKNEGLLAYKWEESTMGPPRKYYHLTPKGTAILAEFERSWSELASAVEILHKNRI